MDTNKKHPGGFLLKALPIVLLLFAATFNLQIAGNHASSSDVTLKNLEALRSGAGEMWCDTSTPTSCTIKIGNNGPEGRSTGNLHHEL